MIIFFARPYILIMFLPFIIILLILIRKSFVKFETKKERLAHERSKRKKRIFIMITRFFAFLLLFIALASPFTVKENIVLGDPKLSILSDKSKSFELFEKNMGTEIKRAVEKQIPVTLSTFGEDNRSAIGDALLNNMQGGDSLLLVSDGNNNFGKSLGDMMVFASMLNSTVNAINAKPIHDDAIVFVEGPSEVIADTENTFTLVVKQVLKDPNNPFSCDVKLTLDDEVVVDAHLDGPKRISFQRRLNEGYHKIVAELTADDYFRENNVFYKSINAEPKPRLLFVSKKSSPMLNILTELYTVHVTESFPSQLHGYAAVVLDDVPANEVKDIDALSNYILDGNGLVVIGGQSSYDKGNYKSSLLETLLPVQVGEPEERRKKDVNVILAIDISTSTASVFRGGTGYTTEAVEKALALSILDDMKDSDNIAVLAFNNNVYTLSPFSPLGDKREEIEYKISHLTFLGGTFIPGVIEEAKDMLKRVKGSKYIILISDGGQPTNREYAKYFISNAAKAGVVLYTVGVGVDLQTDVKFMEELAQAGNGIYFEPTELQRIKIIFESYEEGKEEENPDLEILNRHHFITRGLELDANVYGHNRVIAKSSADQLIATVNNHPILSVWRFGLGRIASLTTDDGFEWAPKLLSKQNSLLISRMMNWAIGDLGRAKDFDVDIKDTWLGEQIQVNVRSKLPPSHETLSFSKIDEELYTASYIPNRKGFYKFFNALVAVNYEKEVSEVGINPELKSIVKITGGEIFDQRDVDEIVRKVIEDSKKVVIETVNYRWIFALAAAIIFLIEIAYRRLTEFKLKKI